MTGRIVTLVVPLPCLASLAVGKKAFVGRGIDGYPYLARLSVHPICMTWPRSAIFALLSQGTCHYPQVYVGRKLGAQDLSQKFPWVGRGTCSAARWIVLTGATRVHCGTRLDNRYMSGI